MTRRTFNHALMALSAATPALSRSEAASVPLALGETDLSYLMADQAERSPDLQTKRDKDSDVKRFWVEGWRDPAQFFEWKLQVPEPGDYEVTAMLSVPPGTKLSLQAGSATVRFEMTWSTEHNFGYNWDRIRLPSPITLAGGVAFLRIRLEDPVGGRVGGALKSLELLNVKQRPALDARIRAVKSDTTWLGKAKFGFMCQCGEWSYPEHGPHKTWPAMIDRFDIQRFVHMVDQLGVGYVIWSATWATYFFPAPIQAIDRIMPGRTSRRDFIGELAQALAEKNIRLILYYHTGHDLTPENGSWWPKNWVSQNDKTLFFDHWCSIVTEVGERYADRLAGWMFDDDLLYYPAPYARLAAAAKAGSKARIISYNPWIQPRGTDFQDFQFGEGFTGSDKLPIGGNGIWTAGPNNGLQAHGNFQLDGPNWGINHPESIISPPRFTANQAVQIALDAAARKEALSWNLAMYDDGSVAPASLAVLSAVASAIKTVRSMPIHMS